MVGGGRSEVGETVDAVDRRNKRPIDSDMYVDDWSAARRTRAGPPKSAVADPSATERAEPVPLMNNSEIDAPALIRLMRERASQPCRLKAPV